MARQPKPIRVTVEHDDEYVILYVGSERVEGSILDGSDWVGLRMGFKMAMRLADRLMDSAQDVCDDEDRFLEAVEELGIGDRGESGVEDVEATSDKPRGDCN